MPSILAALGSRAFVVPTAEVEMTGKEWAKVGAGANSERMETNARTMTNYLVSPARLFDSQISRRITGLFRS
jgi:hypothetical protein